MKNCRFQLLIFVTLFFSLLISKSAISTAPMRINAKESTNKTFFFNATLLTSDSIPERIEWARVIEQELNDVGIGVTFHDITDFSGSILPRLLLI